MFGKFPWLVVLMQFSLKRLLVLFAFFNFLIAAAFAFPPVVSFFVFAFVTLFVLPPFVIVGAVQTRGRQQAFFLGAMIAGTPHFIASLYFAVMLSVNLDFSQLTDSADEFSGFGPMHLVFIMLGAVGGLVGMAAHLMLVQKSNPSEVDHAGSDRLNTIGKHWDDQGMLVNEEPTEPVKLPR